MLMLNAKSPYLRSFTSTFLSPSSSTRSGKTVTLVEAIKQIEKTQTSCRILACAPSNSAADLLCDKILDHVDQRKVYRMYASSRDPKTVPEKLKVGVTWPGSHPVLLLDWGSPTARDPCFGFFCLFFFSLAPTWLATVTYTLPKTTYWSTG